MHQIPKLECFSSRLAVVFVQSIGARCSSWEWRRSWSSTDRRCSSYIWVMNNLIAYWGAPYIRELTALELFGGVGLGGGGGALVHWSLITHFYPRTVCWPVCVYTSVTITCHPFKLESPNVDQKCKTPWLRSLRYCLRGWITLTFKVKCNLEVKIDPIFGLSKW